MENMNDFHKLRLEKKAMRAAKKLRDMECEQKNTQQTSGPLKRSFLTVPQKTDQPKDACTISLMTYNILAQNLVKRELFPYSGDMLKWKTRRRMIIEDIAQYKPDILCLQEVDFYEEYYQEAFDNIGYKTEFFKHPTKQHGCMIGYNPNVFEKKQYLAIEYDEDKLCPPTQQTGNVAQFMALEHTKHKNIGLIVGNTHLYWRPESFYERLRQSTIYAQWLSCFTLDLRETFKDIEWTPLLIGDFNTSPEDPVYNALTRKPLTDIQWKALEDSRRKFGEDKSDDPIVNWVSPQELIGDMENTFPFHSIYSCYGEIDSESSGVCGEPKFTNYAAVYSGTLDYLFIEKSALNRCSVAKVLEIPAEEVLKPALPNKHFGSDHLCLVTMINF
ncbi:Endonuclease/exonuclease/phosphatase [Phycomyces nitens]|nr:Endonuclease/exonuclease/phosphatase [Phycomyces nitens]